MKKNLVRGAMGMLLVVLLSAGHTLAQADPGSSGSSISEPTSASETQAGSESEVAGTQEKEVTAVSSETLPRTASWLPWMFAAGMLLLIIAFCVRLRRLSEARITTTARHRVHHG